MKLLIIGLDCADWKVINDLRGDLPNISMIVEEGLYGNMRTTFPPITIPAWLVMATGKSPGELGVYGFRHRKHSSYTDFWIVDSRRVKERKIWDIVGERGMRSTIIGLPPTYPPTPIRGYMISDFITPDDTKTYTYPPMLKKDIERLIGKYIFDVEFRREDKSGIKRELWDMTERRFKVIRYLLSKKWDLFWFVEIGVDRAHHAFWKYYDKEHHLYQEHPEYSNVIPNYYKMVDDEIGKILSILPKDTAVMLVSDHGVKRMKGAFAINDYLAKEGLLRFEKKPKPGTRLGCIDWSKTVAWGWGGYYARVFINVQGREPKGVIPPGKYDETVEHVADTLRSARGPNGEKWKNIVVRPSDIYPVVKGDPPDLMVVFDDLYWRSAGTVGYDSPYLPENDTGPDDAMHDWNGVFALWGEGIDRGRRDVDILDIMKIMTDVLTKY